MCSTAAHQPSEVVRLCRSTYASRYSAVQLGTFSRRNRMSHALLAREAEGLKPSRAAYLVTVGIWLSSHKIWTGLATYSRLRISGRVMVIEYDLTRFGQV